MLCWSDNIQIILYHNSSDPIDRVWGPNFCQNVLISVRPTVILSRLFRGFDEDYVNDKENALMASFSKSHNLEDMP